MRVIWIRKTTIFIRKKNRNGPVGSCDFVFDGKFYEIPWDWYDVSDFRWVTTFITPAMYYLILTQAFSPDFRRRYGHAYELYSFSMVSAWITSSASCVSMKPLDTSSVLM